MSTPPQQINLVDKLRADLRMGEKMLAYDRYTPGHGRRFMFQAKDSLTKIFGAESELVKEFNNIATTAVGSDPKVVLQKAFNRLVQKTSQISQDCKP